MELAPFEPLGMPPFEPIRLERMDAKHIPIRSEVEDDPELQDEVRDFVIGLAERVDVVQDAETTRDLVQVERLCADLARESDRLGFGPLAAVARVVCSACLEDKADVAQEALVELTDVSRRIRLGHRGAA